MRLLHVTHQYAPAIGGSEQYMTDLSEALVRRGHCVDVFTTKSRSFWTWRDELPRREHINGVRVFRYSSLRRRGYTWRLLDLGYDGYRPTRRRMFQPLILAGNGPLSAALAWNLWRRASGYDLIHVQTLPYAHLVYGYHIARRSGRPVVLTPHLHVGDPGIFDVEMFNNALCGADQVIADSGIERDYLMRLGVAPERVLVAGVGIRPELYPVRDKSLCRRRLDLPVDAIVLLFLGRKVAYKGLAEVIEAFAALQGRHEELWLLAAGPPTEESRSLRSRWSGLDRFRELDAVSEDGKLDLLNACDALLLPSTSEAFGIVFLEAWAVGKAVIGARAGAIPSIIDDEHDGLLAEPNDVTSLTQQIERLILDPDLRQRLGIAGRRKALGRYTVDCIAAIIEDAYRRVIDAQGTDRHE